MRQGALAIVGGLVLVTIGCKGGGEPLEPPPEICDDNIDNDEDGASDCADSECSSDPACAGGDVEICDDLIDNDANGDFDCSDLACDPDPLCDPAEFGLFFDTQDITFNELSGDCALPNPFPDFDLSPGGIFFPTFDTNTNVFFEFAPGTTNPAIAADLVILGGAGDDCSVNISSFGDPIRYVINVHCTSPQGGSCDHGYNTP